MEDWFKARYRPARRSLISTKRLLAPDRTLLPAYRSAFAAWSRKSIELWRPTEEIRAQGPLPPPFQHLSFSRLIGLLFCFPRAAEQLSREYRLDARISIGLHVRLGDKAGEQQGALSDLGREAAASETAYHQGNLRAYVRASLSNRPALPVSRKTSDELTVRAFGRSCKRHAAPLKLPFAPGSGRTASPAASHHERCVGSRTPISSARRRGRVRGAHTLLHALVHATDGAGP